MTDEMQLPPGDVAPATAEHAPAEDPNAVASAAAPSSTAETTSAPTVSADAGVSQTAASSADLSVAAAPAPDPSNDPSLTAPQTFEQRVEARFLELEQHFLNLPHAIAQANGHPEPASWGTRVLNFLFGKNEEPSA